MKRDPHPRVSGRATPACSCDHNRRQVRRDSEPIDTRDGIPLMGFNPFKKKEKLNTLNITKKDYGQYGSNNMPGYVFDPPPYTAGNKYNPFTNGVKGNPLPASLKDVDPFASAKKVKDINPFSNNPFENGRSNPLPKSLQNVDPFNAPPKYSTQPPPRYSEVSGPLGRRASTISSRSSTSGNRIFSGVSKKISNPKPTLSKIPTGFKIGAGLGLGIGSMAATNAIASQRRADYDYSGMNTINSLATLGLSFINPIAGIIAAPLLEGLGQIATADAYMEQRFDNAKAGRLADGSEDTRGKRDPSIREARIEQLSTPEGRAKAAAERASDNDGGVCKIMTLDELNAIQQITPTTQTLQGKGPAVSAPTTETKPEREEREKRESRSERSGRQ